MIPEHRRRTVQPAVTTDAPPRRSPADLPRIAVCAGGPRRYCNFDNTDKLHAPDNAHELIDKPGLRLLQPEPAMEAASQ